MKTAGVSESAPTRRISANRGRSRRVLAACNFFVPTEQEVAHSWSAPAILALGTIPLRHLRRTVEVERFGYGC
jgi:hypothetical protein